MAVIPDPRNDENLAVAQTHLALIRFHNRVVDTLPFLGSGRAAVCEGQGARRQALPVDAPPRLPAPDLRRRVVRDVFTERPQGIRGGREPDGRPDDADRVLGGRLPARAQHGPRTSTAGTSASTSAAPRSTSSSTSREGAAASAAARGCRATGSRTFAGSSTSKRPAGRPGRAGREVQPRHAHRHGSRPDAPETPQASPPARRSNLALRNLRPGEDAAARDRPADGAGSCAARASRSHANQGADSERQERRRPRGAHQGAARRLPRRDTPLWFYILREAELEGGKLRGVGARLVAETFHRAMEGSEFSIVRDKAWRPSSGRTTGPSGWSTSSSSPSRGRRPCSRRSAELT